MLTMTPSALAVARKVTDHPRLGRRSGLRIARTAEDARLQVCAVTGPRAGDEVVERDGARIYLGPAAGSRLRGRMLDVGKEQSGRFHVIVRQRR